MIKRSPKLTPNQQVFGFLYLALQFLVIPSLLTVINRFLLPAPLSDAKLNFVFFAMNFLAVLLIFRSFLAQNLRLALAQPWRTLRFAGLGLLIYFVGTGLFSSVIFRFLPDYANVNNTAVIQLVEQAPGLLTFATVILVPLTEEVFYRGLFFRQLFDRHPIPAYAVSMVVFSAIHIGGYLRFVDALTLLVSFFQYLPAGFALCWSYHHSGNICAPILIHMAVNQVGILALR